jgi:amino acid transporter
MVSGIVLYMFRGIYSEVVTALPVNGGTYTVLLNTTAKSIASLAACLTMLSYVSTAVVSASVAITYLTDLWPGLSNSWGTVVLLGIFAVLNLFGIKDSANVAVCIFGVHMTIMVILIVDCIIYAVQDGFSILAHNYHIRNDVFIPYNSTYTPDPTDPANQMTIYPLAKALVFGFSSAMLGITGFETSANYVEEQRKGVFVKTLRNMWYCVAFLNPTISLLSLSVLPLHVVRGYPLVDGQPDNNDLLQKMARGGWLSKLVSIDAFMVLAGSVLTAYVGVTGLVRRMAFDRCLPDFLLQTNKLFKTNHVIIIGFFLVCTSLFFITDQNVLILASVYTISFLSVMSLFSLGNLILKYKRSRIRREHRAKVPIVLLSLAATITAIYGNIVINGSTIQYFFLYYGITLVIVGIMFQRVHILRMLIRGLIRRRNGEELDPNSSPSLSGLRGRIAIAAINMLRQINDQKIVFFLKEADIRLMNKAIEYVRDNEQTQNLQFVHVYVMAEGDEPIPLTEQASGRKQCVCASVCSGVYVFACLHVCECIYIYIYIYIHVCVSLRFGRKFDPTVCLLARLTRSRAQPGVKTMLEDIATLQRIYPKMKLDFCGLSSRTPFDGHLVKKISEKLDVPPHFMFISCPSENFKHDIAQLGGVRLITGAL